MNSSILCFCRSAKYNIFCVCSHSFQAISYITSTDIPTSTNSVPGDVQQHTTERTICDVEQHTTLHDDEAGITLMSCVQARARLVWVPGYFIQIPGIREPLSICGRLPELPGDLGCLHQMKKSALPVPDCVYAMFPLHVMCTYRACGMPNYDIPGVFKVGAVRGH